MWLFSAAAWMMAAVAAYAQDGAGSTITALRIQASLHIDGLLDETAWQSAEHIANFTQRELAEGEQATERTEVGILYDRDNLYIGVWCYDRAPDKLAARKMQRDFDADSEDNFKIVIDTYHDQRTGYLFVTNPNGARADALVIDNGQRVNEDWDGVWMVRTKVAADGWFAEFEIPFSTLKFASGTEQSWGINFERNIRRKREQVLWQGWTRDAELEQVSRAGTLLGLRGINKVNLLEVRPYLLGGLQKPRALGSRTQEEAGADLNYLVTPTMKLNVTINPDFAQVESDRAQVNLTRFSLFFPEKRKFFLEGQNFFDFSLGRSIRPFHSRQIGLTENREAIRILGGARVLGKQGRSTLGGMVLQTAAKDSIRSTSYAVARWKQDILQQSSLGVIAVSKVESGRTNITYGFDFLYSSSSLFGNKNFILSAALAQSYTSGAVHKTGSAHRMVLDYPNNIIDFSAIWDRSGEAFNPEVGFMRRQNFQMYNADLRIKPRPGFLPWIQRLEFKPFDFNYYVDDHTGKLQTLWSEIRPLGFSTKSGESFEFNIQRQAEKPVEDFEIADDVIIPGKEYWFTRYELQIETFGGRSLSADVSLQWGDFYNGSRTEWGTELTWRLSKYISLNADYQRNTIGLPAGDFTVDEVGGRANFAFSPNLFGSVFGQWNSEDEEILLNFRINWIPQPGADFFFVLNHTAETAGATWLGTNTTASTKFVWRFVL